MSIEKSVPEIRFEGFSGEWEEIDLASMCSNFRSGKFIKAEDIKQNGVYPVYGGNGLRGFTSEYNHEGVYALIGRQGALCGNMNFSYGKAFFTEHAIAVQANAKNDTHFLYYKLGLMNLGQYSGQSAQPGLSVNKITELETYTPEKQEQTAIGNTFQKLDSLINQHQQKHDKLSNIKKAMLEKMFPKQGETIPDIRFKGFSGKWEEIELSEEVTFINGRAYSQEELQDKGKYSVLRVGNFYTNSSWYYSDMELGDKYYANCGDLLYTWSASFGPHIWDGDKVIYHYHIWKLELSDNIDKLFLLHLLDYDRAKILSGSNGSTMIHITKSAMEAKKVFIPKIDEQIVIGNYFQKLDTLLNQHQQQITKLNNIKQACLSKMFV